MPTKTQFNKQAINQAIKHANKQANKQTSQDNIKSLVQSSQIEVNANSTQVNAMSNKEDTSTSHAKENSV
jgi:hypothetical protein